MKAFSALGRSGRVALFLGTLVTAVASSQALVVTDAKAASSTKAKVAVGGFEGNKSKDARSAFIDALKKDGGYEVTDAEDIKPWAKPKAVVEGAAGLGVSVVITGKVGKGGLKLKVLDAADGKLIEEVEVKGAAGKLKGNIGKTGASSVADAVRQAKGAEKEEPEEEEPKPEEEKPEEEKPSEEVSADTSNAGDAKGLSPLDITAGLRAMHRTFEFNDTPSPLLRYELPLGPLVFIDANWFPGSHFTEGPGEWIGITAGFEKGFATQSIYDEGKPTEVTLKTDQQQFYVGGRFRVPLGDHMAGLTATYGQHKFDLAGDDGPCNPPDPTNPKAPCPKIPDLNYQYVKIGLDGMFQFGDFMAGIRIGKRFVTNPGRIKPLWFPNVKTQSLEAGVTVGYRLVSTLDLVAGFDWLRYGLDFNPVPVRTGYVAGGAVDQYLSGYIAFRFHLPGKGQKAPE
jgi:hypothetical protein